MSRHARPAAPRPRSRASRGRRWGGTVLGLSAVVFSTLMTVPSGGLDTAASARCPQGTADEVAVARVNIDGPRVTVGGTTWSADPTQRQDPASTVTEDRNIRGTRADVLHRTSRVGEFRYEVPVSEPGRYVVRLHATEPWFGVDGRQGGRGSRVFSVSIEDGQAGSREVDVLRSAGGPLRAWAKSWTAQVEDGNVTVEGRAVRDLPVVSAIEVLRKHPRGTCAPVTGSGGTAADPAAPPVASTPAPQPAPAPQAAPAPQPAPAPQAAPSPEPARQAAPAPQPATAAPGTAAPQAQAAPAQAAAAPAAVGALRADAGRPFAPTSAYNTPIPAGARVDPNSAAMVRSVAASNRATANLYAYGDPVFSADTGTPAVPVQCTEDWGTCDLEQRPQRIPADARPTSGSDGRMIIVDLAAGTSCDYWQARRSGSGWSVSWGTCAPLNGTGSGPNGGATGGGINALAGVVRTFEIRSGNIPHALSIATGNSCAGQFRAPATKTDGNSTRSDCIPEGARLQLDPSIDVNAIPGITPGERAVARALQTYGAINRDNCGADICVAFENPIGEADPYPAVGFTGDYFPMAKIPWSRMRVVQ